MSDRVVSFVCPHCDRSFKSSHLCQRHLRCSHGGLPAAFPTTVLLHGLHGADDGFPQPEPGGAAPVGAFNGRDARGGAAFPAASAADEGAGGLEYVGEAPPLADTSIFCSSPHAGLAETTSVSGRVRQFYESFRDAATSRPMHLSSGQQRTRFDSPFLRTVLRHATLANWTGSSRSSSKSLWRMLTTTPDGGEAPQRSGAAAILSAFKSPSAFTSGIKHEQERLVHIAGWLEAPLQSCSGTYDYMYRNGLTVLLGMLRDAPVRHVFTPAAVGVPAELVGPSRGGIFEMYEADVRRTHGERAFVLPFSLFSDGTTLPNSKAVSAHPLRICPEFLPADLPRKWLSLGAFPQVIAQLGRAGSERAREARRELLQRAMFLTMDDMFKASHDGVLVDLGGDLGVWRVFPRLVCYSADYPEKRILLCLRGIGCTYQCSTCMATLRESCSENALCAAPRGVVGMVLDQLTARNVAASGVRGGKAESERLCELHSCNSLPPALACMAGLGTRPYLLFRAFGLDTLHVR